MTIKERLVSDHLEIIAFAAKIKPSSKTKIAEGATIDALENSSEKIIRVSELGGTPHQSAARFVFDQKTKRLL